jgi:hypothetical protein
MDDVLASWFGKTRARRWFQNQKMRRTQKEHSWWCPRVMRWLGQVTQGCQGMLQESRPEENSRVTLTGFTGNTTRIGRQIRLLGTAGVTGTDTRVGRQTRLLGIAGVTRTTTQVGGQTGLLRIAGVIGTVAQVSRPIELLGSAGVTETATQSREILARLQKIWLTRKTGLCKTRGGGGQKLEEEKVLLQAKGQLHADAQGVLPRHKNAD